MKRRRGLAAFALLLACSGLHAATVATGAAEREMVDGSNAFRAGQGLPPVRPDPALSRAARAYADYMAQTERYGHEADGRQPFQRSQAAGYAHCMVAENIAWQYNSGGFTGSTLAQGFVQGWIESPPHRRNLLAPEATDIGIAVARSAASGRWYAVQMLGRPAALGTRFELENRSAQGVRYQVGGRTFQLPPGTTRWHEQCGAARVEVDLPGGRGPAVVDAGDGARYRVDRNGALVSLQ